MTDKALLQLDEVGSAELTDAAAVPVAVDAGPLKRTSLSSLATFFRQKLAVLTTSDRGVANGVASLGADGKVPSSQLPAATSGDFIPSAQRGQANGVASLGSDGKVPAAQLPASTGGGSSVPPGTYVPVTDKGQANGVASLGADGKVPSGQLPSTALTVDLPASQKGAPNGVASLGADGKVPATQLPAASSGGGSSTMPNFVTDFGAVAGNTPACDAAMAAYFASAYERVWVPEGLYPTSVPRASWTKRFEGPGKIQAGIQGFAAYTRVTGFNPATSEYGQDLNMQFSDRFYKTVRDNSRKNLDEPYFYAPATPTFFEFVTKPGAGWSGLSAYTTAVASGGSIQVTSSDGFAAGDAISIGNGQDDGTAERTTVTSVAGNTLFVSPALTLSHPTNSVVSHGRRTMNSYNLGIMTNQAGGDNYLWCGRMINSYAPITGQSHIFNTATTGMIGGDMTFTNDGLYMTGWECQYDDTGHDGGVAASVNTYWRKNDTGARGAFWVHDFGQSVGTKPIDGVWVFAGPARIGMDVSRADFSSNGQAAVQLANQQRIYFNASGSPTGRAAGVIGNVLGTTWIGANSDVNGNLLDLQVGSARLRIRQDPVGNMSCNFNGGMNVAQGLGVTGNLNLAGSVVMTGSINMQQGQRIYLSGDGTCWIDFQGDVIRFYRNGTNIAAF